jgi:hypothetical protein
MEVLGETKSWDFGFMESLQEQVTKGRTLSGNQERHLHQIEGRFSDEALAARGAWETTWDDEKEQKFTIALRYYRKTGYYSNLVNRHLDVEDKRIGIPLEKDYNKLVNNKYAQGVIANVMSDPKFPVGSTAIFRASAGYQRKNVPVIILKNCDPDNLLYVRSHARGAKPVQVLMVGSAEPIWTEERMLKNPKKRK